jgi:hypothetical protein
MPERNSLGVEGTDQVLPFRQVHACFTANGAIDLRHHCGRHVHQPYAAKIARRNESADVADDASAHGNDHGAAVSAGADQLPA